MELQAVIQGLTYVRDKGHSDAQIYSDSAYVVNAIKKGWLGSWAQSGWVKRDGSEVKNSDLWRELLDVLRDFKHFEFIKVKGHNGDMFNEIADRYAREEVKKLLALQ